MTALDAPSRLDRNIILNCPDRDLLVAMAVHELNEPLHAVQSFLSVILEGRTGPLNDAQVDFLSTASQATRRIVRRIEDFRLVFASELPFQLECQDVNLFEHIRNCRDELRFLSESHGVAIDIREESTQDFVSSCWVDPDRLDQMLLNLLENAIRYSRPGTSVNVFVREMTNDAKALIVQNTADLETTSIRRWIEPYWRGNTDQPSKPTGMGLGLAIVNHVVQAHGGVLQTWGKGCRIYVGLALPARNDGLVESSKRSDLALSLNGSIEDPKVPYTPNAK